MLKFFFIILQIVLVLIIVSIIVNNSFTVSFALNDYIYSISSSYLFIFLIFIFLLLFFLQSFYFKTKFRYSKYKVNKFLKNKNKGYDSFVNGMIALANKDYKKAIVESKKISKYMNDNSSLSLLLKSEIYKIEKKYDDLNLVYLEMIKDKSTENLAFRGMMEQYLRSQDYHHAFIYGEKLFNKNPFIEKIYDALVNIISKTKNWQQLISITDKAYSKKIIDKKTFQENKSIGLFEIAKIKQFSELKESIIFIEKSLTLRNNFPPYIKFYLELLINDKNYNKAKKILRKAWNEKPHPEYKSIIIKLATNLKIDTIELTKFIIGNNLHLEDSKILLVEISILNQNWDMARNYIKGLLDVEPKKEVCLLMAKIEEGDSGDIQKINSWTLRAKNGAEKNVWICMISNKSQDEWSSVSRGGYFNSLEWKQSYMLSEFKNIDLALNYEN